MDLINAINSVSKKNTIIAVASIIIGCIIGVVNDYTHQDITDIEMP